MPEQRHVSFTLKNERNENLPVFVEPWPEHYQLRKDETLRIAFEPRTDAPETLEFIAHDEGLTIYPDFVGDPAITIDGKDASKRSWPD